MDPFFARNRLSAYLDGTLPDGDAAEVEAALAQDPALRREFDEMRRAVELLRTAGPTRAPEGFHARVMAAVEHEPAPGGLLSFLQRSLQRVPVEAMALAAAAVIVVVVIQGSRDEGEPDDVAAQLDVRLPSRSSPLASARSDATTSTDPTSEGAAEAGGPAEGALSERAAAGSTGPAETWGLAEDVQAGAGGSPAPPKPPAARLAQADGDLRTGGPAAAPATSTSKDGRSDRSGATSARTPASRKVSPVSEDAPYYAEWEQPPPDAPAAEEPEPDLGSPAVLSNGIDMAPPRAFRLARADSEILYELAAAASSAGGRLTDSSGADLVARELTDTDTWMRVQLIVPQDQTERVTRRLRDMGGVTIPPPGSQPVLYTGDTTVFIVELSHRP